MSDEIETPDAIARPRRVRHGKGSPAAVVKKTVVKRYTSRLPVSGQEPPRVTKYEAEKMARRGQA